MTATPTPRPVTPVAVAPTIVRMASNVTSESGLPVVCCASWCAVTGALMRDREDARIARETGEVFDFDRRTERVDRRVVAGNWAAFARKRGADGISAAWDDANDHVQRHGWILVSLAL